MACAFLAFIIVPSLTRAHTGHVETVLVLESSMDDYTEKFVNKKKVFLKTYHIYDGMNNFYALFSGIATH